MSCSSLDSGCDKWYGNLNPCCWLIPNSADQAEHMSGNFGGSINQDAKSQTISEFQDWLKATGYDESVSMNPFTWIKEVFQNPLDPSKINWTPIVIGVVGIVVVSGTLGSGSPRRYGR